MLTFSPFWISAARRQIEACMHNQEFDIKYIYLVCQYQYSSIVKNPSSTLPWETESDTGLNWVGLINSFSGFLYEKPAWLQGNSISWERSHALQKSMSPPGANRQAASSRGFIVTPPTHPSRNTGAFLEFWTPPDLQPELVNSTMFPISLAESERSSGSHLRCTTAGRFGVCVCVWGGP